MGYCYIDFVVQTCLLSIFQIYRLVGGNWKEEDFCLLLSFASVDCELVGDRSNWKVGFLGVI